MVSHKIMLYLLRTTTCKYQNITNLLLASTVTALRATGLKVKTRTSDKDLLSLGLALSLVRGGRLPWALGQLRPCLVWGRWRRARRGGELGYREGRRYQSPDTRLSYSIYRSLGRCSTFQPLSTCGYGEFSFSVFYKYIKYCLLWRYS